MENTVKKCVYCGNLFTLEHFRRTRLSADGHANICMECARKRRGEKKALASGGGNPELAKFQPRELIEELRARGYTGTLKITKEINV